MLGELDDLGVNGSRRKGDLKGLWMPTSLSRRRLATGVSDIVRVW